MCRNISASAPVFCAASAKDQAAESNPLSSSAAKTHVDVKTSSHFMPYFITITIIVVMLYVVYHKRNLVMKWWLINAFEYHINI